MTDAASTSVPLAPRPLSEDLREMLAQATPEARLTPNRILAWTEGRSVFFFIVILCFPFLAPVSVPGMSVLLGSVVLLLGLALAFDLPRRLPRRLGERPLSPRFHRVIAGSIKVLRQLEKLVRPRRTAWMTWRAVRLLNALALALMGLCLALPIPPVIPLTNTLPAYAILFIALSMMEGDGAMIWCGYGIALGTLFYFYFIADVVRHVVERGLSLLLS